MPARLRVIGVSKSFGATRALRNVNLEIAPGEVHALIGENGAGKSTLMKVLSGACRPDAGRIELEGQPFIPADPLHARHCGISMIYQELNLAPHLSVEENILLGEEPARCGWLQRGKRRELARAALSQLRHENIPLDAPVHTRSIAEQQIVEIARALVGRPKVLIMDEPTSSLTQADVENLFRVIGHLRESGVSVIYISHFLEECQRICQRYTVLRDGESVATGDMTSANLRDIVHLMVGREIQEVYPRVPHEMGQPLLKLRQLAGLTKPRSATLTLREGEILGVAGLIGAGRTETVRAAFGLDCLKSGEVLVYGQDKTFAAPSDRLRDGIGLLSENRKEEGLMLNLSIADNLTLTRLQPLASCGFVRSGKQQRASAEWMQRLDVRASDPWQTVSELSGGNQQKVALGRLLHHDARILLLDEPTRGIDVGSKAEIYRWMGQLAADGRAILFVSSYLPELLGVCDTIAVMCRGVITQIRPAAEWTEHSIMAAAIGQS
ncbi:MAG TPA: sugar ABC transporter ATP-binding protein [Verrucomicrobiae bacterium]|nr:sugar ABC transporter ATP-binding protein [Verrucomicrobiae bacterium]